MIHVYYWPTVNGRKITIALEEMGLSYRIRLVNMRKGETTSRVYLAVNPNGKIPALVDDDVDGLVIFESAAILQYLAEKSGKLLPTDTKGRYDVLKWLVFQAATVGPMLGQLAHFHDYARERIPYALNRYLRECDRIYAVLELRLGEAEYLGGPAFSIADISTWTWIQPGRQEQRWEDWPNLWRWHQAIASRPGVQRGNAVMLELQTVGVQKLTDAEFNAIYRWQLAPRGTSWFPAGDATESAAGNAAGQEK